MLRYPRYRRVSAMDRMYGFPLWRNKPFAFAERGMWGSGQARLREELFGFLKSHPRVRMAVYYQSAGLKPEFRLSTHPASRAALRRGVKRPRLTGVAPLRVLNSNITELRVRCVHCGARRPIGEAPCPECGAPPHPHKSTVDDFQARMDALHGTKRPRRRPSRGDD